MEKIFVIVEKKIETYGHGDFGHSYKLAMTNPYNSPPPHPAFASEEQAMAYLGDLKLGNYGLSVMALELMPNAKASEPLPPTDKGPIRRPVRPACWDFAMDFLGDPEAPLVEAYVASLEAEIERLRTGDTCGRMCEGTAYRIEARRLAAKIASAPVAIMDTRDALSICAPTEADFQALYAIQGKRVRLVLDEV